MNCWSTLPDYLSTVQLPVVYDQKAQCPAFEKFLTQVLPPDCYEPTEDSPQGFIWELIGYLMYSGNPLHIAILLRGSGRNGKGTLIRVFKALLGEHNTSAVGLHDLTENRFRTATLLRQAGQPRRGPRLEVDQQHRDVQGDHRRRHRPGRDQIRKAVRLHPVGAADLLSQQAVRVGGLVGGLARPVGRGPVPQQLPGLRGPHPGRQADDRRRAAAASWRAGSRRCPP